MGIILLSILYTILRGLSSLSEVYRPRDSRMSEKLVLTFADKLCYLVSVTYSFNRNLGLLDFFFF
jgi:hypothetical protein